MNWLFLQKKLTIRHLTISLVIQYYFKLYYLTIFSDYSELFPPPANMPLNSTEISVTNQNVSFEKTTNRKPEKWAAPRDRGDKYSMANLFARKYLKNARKVDLAGKSSESILAGNVKSEGRKSSKSSKRKSLF